MQALQGSCRVFRRETYRNPKGRPDYLAMKHFEEQAVAAEDVGTVWDKGLVPRVHPQVFWRTEHFGALVFRASDEKLFSVDEAGHLLLSLIDERRTLGEIVEQVSKQAKASPAAVNLYMQALDERRVFVGHPA